MHYIHQILLSDFVQVLNSARKYPTKNKYFSKHSLFSTIYLLQGQELNHRIYSKKKLIMSILVQATDHDGAMYANFECLDVYRFFCN
jgi:hypothetical protein